MSVEGASAIVAVSEGMRADLLSAYPDVDPGKVHVIYNGIDAEQYAPDPNTDVIERYGVDTSRPSVVFVGRITRQKGVPVLLRAAAHLDPDVQLVLCAGAPDTPELGAEVAGLVDELRKTRSGVIWLSGMLSKREVIQLLSHSTLFACPSVYEPLGIVNLEAMACGTAVVASKTGGIPEVVADGDTGLLVPPDDPQALAESINSLTRDPERARRWAPRAASGPRRSSTGDASPSRRRICTGASSTNTAAGRRWAKVSTRRTPRPAPSHPGPRCRTCWDGAAVTVAMRHRRGGCDGAPRSAVTAGRRTPRRAVAPRAVPSHPDLVPSHPKPCCHSPGRCRRTPGPGSSHLPERVRRPRWLCGTAGAGVTGLRGRPHLLSPPSHSSVEAALNGR